MSEQFRMEGCQEGHEQILMHKQTPKYHCDDHVLLNICGLDKNTGQFG